MSSSVSVLDGVRKTENLLLVTIVPLQRDLYALFATSIIASILELNRFLMECRSVLVEVLDETLNAPGVGEDRLLVGAFIDELDAHAAIEKSEFTHPLSECFVVKIHLGKDIRIRPEVDPGSGLLCLS